MVAEAGWLFFGPCLLALTARGCDGGGSDQSRAASSSPALVHFFLPFLPDLPHHAHRPHVVIERMLTLLLPRLTTFFATYEFTSHDVQPSSPAVSRP